MKKEESHIVQGLSRDASVEQFDNKYVYEMLDNLKVEK